MTPVLQSANFPVARWEDCFEAYEQIHNRRLNVRTQLCAGSEGNDACAGDSGGALVVRPRDGRNNVYYQECILLRTFMLSGMSLGLDSFNFGTNPLGGHRVIWRQEVRKWSSRSLH